MDLKLDITSRILLVLLASTLQAQATNIFDVTKYGAKCDGKTDSTQAFQCAWKDACASTCPSRIVVPKGTFVLRMVEFSGPCKAPIEFQLDGTLKAPADTKTMMSDSWINFKYINNFKMYGCGALDGQGQVAWQQNNCAKDPNCELKAINLRLDFITNALICGVTSLNSKNFHVNVLGCKNLTFDHFTVSAPGESLNTDGIHIGRSFGINITNTNIQTGDDCISLGDGSQQIRVTGVRCGPGHGISVGSLGKYPNEFPVSGVFVKNCTLTGTTNGVRIKSWPALYGGSASNMVFENIIMNNVSNPILIDQTYCPWNHCNMKSPSKVSISNVSFKDIRGTSASELGIKLACSAGIPCKKVELGNINLKYTGSQATAKSLFNNVKPTILGGVSLGF